MQGWPWMLALVVVAGCSSTSPFDSGEELAHCTECGPGALELARFGDGYGSRIAASDVGAVAVANRGHVGWLDERLVVGDSDSIEFRDDGMQPDVLRIGASGDLLIETSWRGDFEEWASLIAYAPDHAVRWRFNDSKAYAIGSIAVGAEMVIVGSSVVPNDRFEIGARTLYGHFVGALDLASGEVVWWRPLGSSDNLSNAVTVAVTTDGGVAIAGQFTGTLDLGGAVPPITSTGRGSGFVAKLDAHGEGVWAATVDTTEMTGRGSVPLIAAGTENQVAVYGEAVGAGATFAGQPLANGGCLALLDGSTGLIRWLTPISASTTPTSLVSEGNDIIVAGSFVNGNQSDGFLADFGPERRWLRAAIGEGEQTVAVLGANREHIVLSITSAPVRDTDPVPEFMYGDVGAGGAGTLVGTAVR